MKKNAYLQLIVATLVFTGAIILANELDLIKASYFFFDWQIPAIPIFVALFAIIISFFTKNERFQFITYIVLLPVCLLACLILWYFVELGHSYAH